MTNNLRDSEPTPYIFWDAVSERVDGQPISADDMTHLHSALIRTAENLGYTFGGSGQRKTQVQADSWPEGAV